MIKIFFILPYFFYFFASEANDQIKKSSKEQNGTVRLFYKKNAIRYLTEYSYTKSQQQNNKKVIQLEAKYVFSPHFRFGGGFKRATGLRHDEDWVWSNGRWLWRDSKDRSEKIIYTRFSYRTLLPSHWDANFETRLIYELNTYNDNQSLKIRPGFNWILSSKNLLKTSTELYFPINYSSKTIYQWGLYLGHLYKINHHFRFGPTVSYHEQIWDLQDESTVEKHKIINLGLSFNIYL